MTRTELKQAVGIVSELRKIEGHKVEVMHFDSAYEMVTKINAADEIHGFKENKGDKREWRYGQGYNLESTTEALKYGTGTKEVIENIAKIKTAIINNESIKHMSTLSETMKRKRVFSEEGSELSIDRVLCGDPYHWEKTTKGKKTKVIKLCLRNGMSASNESSEFFKLCALTIVASELLEQAGFFVEIYSFTGGCNCNSGLSHSIISTKLKSATEPIDIARISTAGLPGFFRYYFFQCVEYLFEGNSNCGYGKSRPFPQEILDAYSVKHLIAQEQAGETNEQVLFLGNLFKQLNDFQL